MEFHRPESWAEALQIKAAQPDAVPVCGGTDVMVELNFDRRRPPSLLDLTRIPDLAEWSVDGDAVRVGAAVTYARVITELAARTVGSPQIRNRGTIGGNLGAASPAGDSHPPLLAAGARVEVASTRGIRMVPVNEFYVGVKRNALAPDELITAIHIRAADGPQQFCKIGTRNAMVIAVSAFAVALHPGSERVGTGIGSAAPTPVAATDAEAFLGAALAEAGLWESRSALPEPMVAEFGRRVAAAASPIDDVRGTAAYRRHSLAVMAGRAVGWAWADYRKAA